MARVVAVLRVRAVTMMAAALVLVLLLLLAAAALTAHAVVISALEVRVGEIVAHERAEQVQLLPARVEFSPMIGGHVLRVVAAVVVDAGEIVVVVVVVGSGLGARGLAVGLARGRVRAHARLVVGARG